MTSPQANETNLKSSFEDLEKEALKEISLEIIRADLLKSLEDQHTKLCVDLEQSCRQEIEKSLEKHLQKQFQSVITSCRTNISEIMSSLTKPAEADLNSLNQTIYQTNHLCHEIQKKYSFRWERPFLFLVLASSLSGAFFGLLLYFLQVPVVSVLLMNDHTRAAYEKGALMKAYEKERDTKDRAPNGKGTP